MKSRRYKARISSRNRDLYSPSYQIARIKWRFHPHDVDPFPSIPHGHSLDKRGYKLNPFSGDIYKGKEVVFKLKRKDHEKLNSDERFQKLVIEARRFHEEINNSKARVRAWRASTRRDSKVFIFDGEVEKTE